MGLNPGYLLKSFLLIKLYFQEWHRKYQNGFLACLGKHFHFAVYIFGLLGFWEDIRVNRVHF